MTHEAFVAAYRAGRIRDGRPRCGVAVRCGPHGAGARRAAVSRFGVALALVGYILTGTLVFIGALLVRFVRRSSDGFVGALQDAEFYRQATSAQALTVEECSTPSRSS